MDKDIEISIDPKLAEFAAKCGTEAFKAYLDFVDKKTTEKVNLINKRLDIERAKQEYEFSEKDSFYNALANICSDVVNHLAFSKSFDNKPNQIQN